MKPILCMLGRHDWTAWRRPPSKLNVAIGGDGWVSVPPQRRRCKRCGKIEQRT